MDLLRQIVAGPKNRYKKDGYNLDLTYITPRIIAMAYPAEGIEKLYRNSIDAVAEFLTKNHPGNYQIINVSGRQINDQILNNIHSFYWEDHKTPEFHILFRICQIMLRHLCSSPDKICVVHCNHGKGRTGTLICCFLLFIGYFQTVQETMKFYARKRFQTEGLGVTQPCQIQYIHYFKEILKKPKIFPSVVCLSKIQLRGGHDLTNPYFKLRGVRQNNCIFNTNVEQTKSLLIEKDQQIVIKMRESIYFLGDVVLQIKHNNLLRKNFAASYAFNTAFLDPKQNKIQVCLQQLSPLSAVKSGIFSNDFKLVLYYKTLCKCSQENKLKDRCEKCNTFMNMNDVKGWQEIYQILIKKVVENPSFIVNGNYKN